MGGGEDKNRNKFKMVTVIPLKKGPFRTNLTYFTAKDIANGSIVDISVRNKKILGLVLSSEDATDAKSDIKNLSFILKKIIEVKECSIFRKEFIESALEISTYFVSRKNDTITSLIPSIFREKYNELAKFKNDTALFEPISQNVKPEKVLFQAPLEDRISFYKTLIRGSFAEKKSIFMVLPTEYDIEVFYESLSKGIENFIFCMHGGLKPKKVIEKYKQIMLSSHPLLILGTAQFLSIPRQDIGMVILEHESSGAYKIIPKSNFDLRTFTEFFSSKIGAKLILGDSLLRFETIARKETEDMNEAHPMSFRINSEGIKIETINPTEGKTSKFAIFSEKSVQEIQNTIKNKKNVFIFSLRKGLATMTICRDCNETVNCEKCLAPVVLYLSRDRKKRMFVCNKCNTEKNPETICAHCGSWNLMPLGIGTDTVFEEVKDKLSKKKIFRLDKESIKTPAAAEKIIKEFEENPGSILIGTEMAFFYLKKKKDLSIVASFDSLWSIPNFRMSEKIIQLLLSIISKTERKIIIQTKNKNDPALLFVKSENLLPLVRKELGDRKNLGYPPYKRFIKIIYLGNKISSLESQKTLREIFKEYNPEIFSGFMAKNKNQYITNALLKLDPQKWSLPELSAGSSIDQNLFNLLSSLPPSYEVSVDPEDLL